MISLSIERRTILAALVGAFGIVACAATGWAQDGEAAAPLDEEKFEKQSGALRTALHYDASLEAPLHNLAKLYREANRGEELISIYRTHTTQYPQDEGARVVFVRLLREMRKPEAAALVNQARKDFPDSSLVAYLAFQEFEKEKDPRALDALSEAISAETQPGRKRLWIDQLVGLAVAEGRPDLASKHLADLAQAPGQSADYLLSLARKMHKAKFHQLALNTLDKARAINTSAELNVDLELVAAAAEASLGQFREAGTRLDQLLEKVAADYWRRPEIVNRRVNLLRTDAAREKMLAEARIRYEAEPKSESAALDLGELLVACELRRDALAVLLEAAQALPNSDRIEKAILGLFDRLNDDRGARDYLKDRLALNPQRADLDYRYVKALFVSGGSAAARERFDGLLAKLDESSRLDQTLDLARYLRRMGLPAAAATMFERVVDLAPERLDVRRELAETFLAVGKRQAARKLFSAELADGAEIENFLDVVQFMIQQEILLEAEKAIANRLADDAQNFELRLLMLDVHGKLGDQLAGERLLESTRVLADTEARYRGWLEAGAKFHELFETLDGFFDAEQSRLVGAAEAAWTPRRIARLLVYCDVADRSQERSRVVEALRAQIGDADTPDALRLELRRLLVRMLENDPTSVAEVEEQLEFLEREDAERSDEYRLRMGKMYSDARRPDLARPLLEKIKFEAITDSRLLTGLHLDYLDMGQPRAALEVLERVATLEPTNRSNWETWLTFLAAMGEEAELRHAIRRLIVGIDRMPLGDETYTLLRGHLVDSYWRTTAHKLASGEDERLGEIYSLLDAIERSGRLPVEQLWVIWTRAHVLNLQGRTRARDEALAQLRDAAEAFRKPAGGGGEGEAGELLIRFPDGLAVSIDSALEILREPPATSAARPTPAGRGPLPELEVDWAFETDKLAPVIQTLPLGGGDVVVFDRFGTLYRIAGKTGKLMWRKTAEEMAVAFPPQEPIVPGGVINSSRYSHQSRPVSARQLPRCAVDADGNVIVPFRGHLLCLAADDGNPRWVAEMGGEPLPGSGVTMPLLVFVDGDRVVGYHRETAVAAAFERTSGKLVWEREVLPEKLPATSSSSSMLTDFSSGASLADGRLLVYGRHAAIIDTRSGNTIWSFEAGAARKFPIRLPAPEDQILGGGLGGYRFLSWSRSPTSAPRPATVDYLAMSGGRGDPSGFAKDGGSLVAPAASWSYFLQNGGVGMGVLAGSRLLMLGNGIDVLSLDLPLAGTHRNLYQHTFVGVSGNKACFLRSNRLSIFNLSRNTLAVADLSPVVESNSAELQVTLAGGRIYASGGKGVMCVNVHTAGEIFQSPWPEAVTRYLLPEPPDSEESPNARAAPSHTNYWQGRVLYNNSALAGSPLQQLALQRAGGVAPTPLADCYPIDNAVAGGHLYALVSPHQLVALSGAEPNKSTTDGSD